MSYRETESLIRNTNSRSSPKQEKRKEWRCEFWNCLRIAWLIVASLFVFTVGVTWFMFYDRFYNFLNQSQCQNQKYDATTPSLLQPWVKTKCAGAVRVYQFNAFLNVPSRIDVADLQDLVNTYMDDTWSIDHVAQYGTAVDIRVLSYLSMTDTSSFQGDRLPIFIGSYGGKGFFHCIHTDPAVDSVSYATGGCNLLDTGIVVPSSFPFFTPYIVIDTDSILLGAYASPANPYNIYGAGIAFPDLLTLSFGISHEIQELMGNEQITSYVEFDQYTKAVQKWHMVHLDTRGNCTNCYIGSDGYAHAPLLTSFAPQGGIFQAIRENGDPYSRGLCSFLQSYYNNGWLFTNYPNPNFWNAYNTQVHQTDFLGYGSIPMDPYCGLHESILFTSVNTSITYTLAVENRGPVNYRTMVDPSSSAYVQFPPGYSFSYVTSIVSSPALKNINEFPLSDGSFLSTLRKLNEIEPTSSCSDPFFTTKYSPDAMVNPLMRFSSRHHQVTYNQTSASQCYRASSKSL